MLQTVSNLRSDRDGNENKSFVPMAGRTRTRLFLCVYDTKMDKSAVSAQAQHEQQLVAFESGMEKQSRDVLDAHTDYNKAHEQQLKEQLLQARRHAQEMDAFKQELTELKVLRAEDEHTKREQSQRQNELEQRHATEVESFNKELKQQRVMREMEMSKQAQQLECRTRRANRDYAFTDSETAVSARHRRAADQGRN